MTIKHENLPGGLLMRDNDSTQHPLFWAGMGKDWGDHSVNHRADKLCRGAWRMRPMLSTEIKEVLAKPTEVDTMPSECPLESAFYDCLDFDWFVDSFYPQPFKMDLVNLAGNPPADFLATLIFFNRDVPEGRRLRPLLAGVNNGNSIAMEVQLHHIQTAAVSAFADPNAFDYKIFTAKEICTPFLKNAKFLSRFGKYATDDRSHFELVGRLHSILGRKRRPAAMTLRALWESAATTLLPVGASAEVRQNKILELMPCLYHEIQKGMFHADLQVTVTSESLVSLAKGPRKTFSPFLFQGPDVTQ